MQRDHGDECECEDCWELVPIVEPLPGSSVTPPPPARRTPGR